SGYVKNKQFECRVRKPRCRGSLPSEPCLRLLPHTAQASHLGHSCPTTRSAQDPARPVAASCGASRAAAGGSKDVQAPGCCTHPIPPCSSGSCGGDGALHLRGGGPCHRPGSASLEPRPVSRHWGTKSAW